MENLYIVDVPEFGGSEISYTESKDYNEATEYEVAEMDEYIESYDEAEFSKADSTAIDDVLFGADVEQSEPIVAEVLQEEKEVLQDEFSIVLMSLRQSYCLLKR